MEFKPSGKEKNTGQEIRERLQELETQLRGLREQRESLKRESWRFGELIAETEQKYGDRLVGNVSRIAQSHRETLKRRKLTVARIENLDSSISKLEREKSRLQSKK